MATITSHDAFSSNKPHHFDTAEAKGQDLFTKLNLSERLKISTITYEGDGWGRSREGSYRVLQSFAFTFGERTYIINADKVVRQALAQPDHCINWNTPNRLAFSPL